MNQNRRNAHNVRQICRNIACFQNENRELFLILSRMTVFSVGKLLGLPKINTILRLKMGRKGRFRSQKNGMTVPLMRILRLKGGNKLKCCMQNG